MINASADYIAALKSPIKQFFLKFEIYDHKMNYLKEFSKSVTENDLGQINVDSSRPVRRNFNFTLFNKNNEFTFGEDRLLWIDKRIMVYTGLKTRKGEIEYIPQGVFVISEPSDSHRPEGTYTTITGQDKAYLMTGNRGKFKYETTIEVGTKVTDAIRLLAGRVGETQFNFDIVDTTVPYTLTYQPGDSLYTALEELAHLAECEVYYDVTGYLRLRKIDLNGIEYAGTVWKYGEPNDRFYAGNVRQMIEDNLANHIIVLGGSGQSATARYELVVTESDPLWKNNPYTIERVGDLLYFHNDGNLDSLVVTDADAKFRAKFELMKRLGYTERISVSISPNYLHDVYDPIEIVDPMNNVFGKYRIESFTIPLKPELMTMQCAKFNKVIDNWDFI